LAGQAAGVALVVLLLGSLGTFFTAARGRMTAQAYAAVPADWQVLVTGQADPTTAVKTVASQPGVTAATAVAFADTTGFKATVSGTTQTTGPGKVLGLPAGFTTTFPSEIRPLVGAADGVLLFQQTAANLGASVGSTVSVGLPGGGSVTETVAGIVDLPYSDFLFQSIGVAAGAAPQAPPDNVMLLPAATWQHVFANAQPGTTSTQVFAQLSNALPPDPGAAFADVVARAKNAEATLSGGGLVGNNLGAQLDATRGDAIYAELLFLFLGLPGVIIAGLLTSVIASSGGERRRREQALLRVRGATPRQIVRLAAWEAALTGAVGVALGLAGAALMGQIAFGTSSFGATSVQAIAVAILAAMCGVALSFATVVMPAWSDARALSVADARAVVGTPKRPLWMRTYVDVLCLGAGGLIYGQAVKSGYQVVLAPEGVPTISVSYFTLMAPLLFWVGAALLIRRLGGTVLKRGRVMLSRVVRPMAHGLSGVVGAGMSRRRTPLARGLTLMALAASFAVSVAVFDTTYAAQARVDAQLTNGADVAVTTAAATGLPPTLASAVTKLPGVAAAQPMLHRFAYVGNDLQDLYGVNPSTIGAVTNMSDAFFGSGTANDVLATLASTPNGVLVSDETVIGFQLKPGDTLQLRLQFADHQYHTVPFVYVGIAREFPTAPHDSFLITNSSYVSAQTGNAAAQTLLIKTNGSPPAVAASVRQLLGPASGANVQDIVTQQKITLSGLTAIDLAGLTRLELVFALLLAAGASGLVLALGLAERRRMFAIASALGAKPRQLAAFVWSEAGFVAIGGSVLGGLVGWGIAQVIVKILTGVFDPPPDHLSAPYGYLVALGAATALAVIVAGIGMLRATHKPAMSILRDL
jgi:putative ABC transport system permease protein